jgi:hypothetical protein
MHGVEAGDGGEVHREEGQANGIRYMRPYPGVGKCYPLRNASRCKLAFP